MVVFDLRKAPGKLMGKKITYRVTLRDWGCRNYGLIDVVLGTAAHLCATRQDILCLMFLFFFDRMPWGQGERGFTELLRDERDAYAELVVLSVQRERLLKSFYEKMDAIEQRREETIMKLKDTQERIDRHRRLADALAFPAEQKRWLQLLCDRCESTSSQQVPSDSVVCSDRARRDSYDASLMSVFHSCLSRSMIQYVKKGAGKIALDTSSEKPSGHRVEPVVPQPEHLFSLAYTPHIGADSNVLRRHPGADICIATSSSCGRVLVSIKPVDPGETVFVEVPFFVCPMESSDVILPRYAQSVLEEISSKSDILNAHQWDSGQVAPLLSYLVALHEQPSHRRVGV